MLDKGAYEKLKNLVSRGDGGDGGTQSHEIIYFIQLVSYLVTKVFALHHMTYLCATSLKTGVVVPQSFKFLPTVFIKERGSQDFYSEYCSVTVAPALLRTLHFYI